MIKLRHNGIILPPSLTVCEEVAREFGPRKRSAGAKQERSEHRERWAKQDAEDDVARAKLARIFEDREEIGMARYGKPLDPGDLTRRWVPETLEELADAAVYLTAEMRLVEPEKRVSAEAKHRWLELRAARRDVEKVMLRLVKLEQ